jgi:heme oxygenase
VLEGSALGGRLVLRAARARLGDDLPVSFFGSVGRERLGADWRALRTALDRHGARHGGAGCQAVVDGAHATFTSMSRWLRGGYSPASTMSSVRSTT